jgi:hypothetical protein
VCLISATSKLVSFIFGVDVYTKICLVHAVLVCISALSSILDTKSQLNLTEFDENCPSYQI